MLNEYQKIQIECKRRELDNFGFASEGYRKKLIEIQEFTIKIYKQAIEDSEKALEKFKDLTKKYGCYSSNNQ